MPVRFHPLVEQTKKNIDKTNLDKGCVISRRIGLDIRVSPKNFDRALKAMDILIKALEQKGAQVSLVKKDYKYITCVTLSGVTLGFDIYEKANMIKRGLDKFGFNQTDFVPSGKLALRIKEQLYTHKEWIDQEKKKIEDRIDDFIEALFQTIARKKELQKEREKWKFEEQKKEEINKLREIERVRFDKLGEDAIRWHKSQIIKSYIEAVTKDYVQKHGTVDSGCEFDQWQAWAIEQTDRLNPIIK